MILGRQVEVGGVCLVVYVLYIILDHKLWWSTSERNHLRTYEPPSDEHIVV